MSSPASFYNELVWEDNKNMAKRFIISEEILAGILQYLQTKPYAEVAQGIQALSQLEVIEEKEVVEKK